MRGVLELLHGVLNGLAHDDLASVLCAGSGLSRMLGGRRAAGFLLPPHSGHRALHARRACVEAGRGDALGGRLRQQGTGSFTPTRLGACGGLAWLIRPPAGHETPPAGAQSSPTERWPPYLPPSLYGADQCGCRGFPLRISAQLAHAAVQAKDAPAGFHAHAFKFQLARARWGAAPKGSRVQLSGGASDSVRNDEGLRDC